MKSLKFPRTVNIVKEKFHFLSRNKPNTILNKVDLKETDNLNNRFIERENISQTTIHLGTGTMFHKTINTPLKIPLINSEKKKKAFNVFLGNTGTYHKNREKMITIFKGKLINTFVLNMQNSDYQNFKTINNNTKDSILSKITHMKSRSSKNLGSLQSNLLTKRSITPLKQNKILTIPILPQKVDDTKISIIEKITTRYGINEIKRKKNKKTLSYFNKNEMYYT